MMSTPPPRGGGPSTCDTGSNEDHGLSKPNEMSIIIIKHDVQVINEIKIILLFFVSMTYSSDAAVVAAAVVGARGLH